MRTSLKRRLSDLLLGHAAHRLGGKHADWAEAMKRENAELGSDDEQLRWSMGCALASYRTPATFDGMAYAAALTAGVMLMTAYQWSADENPGTVAALGLIGFALGLIEPRRSLISGAAIGAVVAAVNSFETLTGLRPAYEMRHHTLLHDARWTVLIAPALVACAIGGYIGRKLRSDPGAAS